ncbi:MULTISPECIES: heme ABC transporter ATP-binding protein [Caldimonas]|uniref:heme ABC transporter ATP-binding protein n=1 Tax=Caldimonas TaxID=196013 RepID=UPI0003790CC9|nr:MULTISPECIES: heme ABC transporter ATP-binding protein [Caldimonas]
MTLCARQMHLQRLGRSVLREVDVELQAAEVLGVLGANGAGKSSLLAALAGELIVQSGCVSLDGRPLDRWEPRALARRRAVLPQSPSLSFDLEVSTVVGMGGYPHPMLSPGALRACCERAMQEADVAALAGRRYLSLSGGEQQRVQFARCLVQVLAGRPDGEYRALLLDEPTASLDPRHQIALMHTVRRLARQEGLAVLLVLHDVNLAAQACDRLLLLSEGRVVAHGPVADVLRPAVLASVYGLSAQVIDHPQRAGCPLVVFDA